MSRFPAAAILAGVLALAGATCDTLSEDADLVVASVGERQVTQAALDRFIASRTGLGGTLDAPLLSALLEELVRERLLVIAAEEEGVEVSEVQLLEETSALRRGPGPEVIRTENDTAAPDSAGDETEGAVDIEASCRLTGRTGVEMEALTAASVAALTVYDMCKAVDRGMEIGSLRLLEKSGGQSGHFKR